MYMIYQYSCFFLKLNPSHKATLLICKKNVPHRLSHAIPSHLYTVNYTHCFITCVDIFISVCTQSMHCVVRIDILKLYE